MDKLKGIPDWQYLQMLASWLEIQYKKKDFSDSKVPAHTYENLMGIAKKLRELEEWINTVKDILDNIEDPDPQISKLVDKHFWELS